MEPYLQPRPHHQRRQRQRVRRAAHVLLHQPHARRRLDVQPARIEAHALADDRDARGGGIAPFQLDQARRAVLRRRLPDGVDHRIAGGERIAARDGDGRAMRGGERIGLRLQFGGAEIAGAGVDQVADMCGGGGDAHRLVDRADLAGQQHARPGGVRLAVTREAMLREQPAQPRRAGRAAVRQPVRSLRQRVAQRRDPPRRVERFVAHQQHRPFVRRLAGQDRAVAGAPGHLAGHDRGAHARRLRGEPAGERVGMDDVDVTRGLAAIGLQQGGEVGHRATKAGLGRRRNARFPCAPAHPTSRA